MATRKRKNEVRAKSSRPLIVLGAVGICLDIVDCVRAAGVRSGLKAAGFLDDNSAFHGTHILGLPVLGPLEAASRFPDALFVCGIGSPGNFRRRDSIIARARLAPDRFATVVHPGAQVSDSAALGRGVVVLANCSVGAGATLGDHVLLLPNCVIGHDSEIGPRTLLAGAVVVSGRVTVGSDCYLGAGAALREGVTIGSGSLLGLGSALVSDMPPGSTFYGNPARSRNAKS